MRHVALAGLVTALLVSHTAAAQESPIVTPAERVGNRSLTDWAVAWSRWDLGHTETQLTTEKECLPQPQPQPVRFLVIPDSDDHVTTVTCTVPAGTYLMLGEPQVFCNDIEPEPEYGVTAAGLRRCAWHYWHELTDPHPRVVLDGRPIANGFVVRTPAFRFRLPRGNWLDTSRRHGRAAVVARIPLIRPLAPGQHTLIQGLRYADTSNIVCVFKLTVV